MSLKLLSNGSRSFHECQILKCEMETLFLLSLLFCVRDPKNSLHFFYFCQKAKLTQLAIYFSCSRENPPIRKNWLFLSCARGNLKQFLAKLSFLHKINDPLIVVSQLPLEGGKGSIIFTSPFSSFHVSLVVGQIIYETKTYRRKLSARKTARYCLIIYFRMK